MPDKAFQDSSRAHRKVHPGQKIQKESCLKGILSQGVFADTQTQHIINRAHLTVYPATIFFKCLVRHYLSPEMGAQDYRVSDMVCSVRYRMQVSQLRSSH